MTSEKKLATNKRYLEQFKVLTLRLKPEDLAAVKEAAAAAGESVAQYIKTAVCDRMAGGALPDAVRLHAAEAAEQNGETVQAWIARAVEDTAARDRMIRDLRG